MKSLLLLVALFVALFAVASAEEQQTGPIACGFCMGIVDTVEQTATKNETVAMLQAAVQKACDRFRISNWCQNNIAAKLPNILNSIIARAPPAKVCSTIKICNSSMVTIPQKRSAQFDLQCSFCESIVGAAKAELTGSNSQGAAQQAISNACNRLGALAGGVCQVLLSTYLSTLVSELQNHVDTHKICTDVRMCH